MAFAPNYNQERAERDKRARAKKAEKQRTRDEKSAQRKAELEAKAVQAPEKP